MDIEILAWTLHVQIMGFLFDLLSSLLLISIEVPTGPLPTPVSIVYPVNIRRKICVRILNFPMLVNPEYQYFERKQITLVIWPLTANI